MTITARSGAARDGHANPTNRYDQGLLRLGTSFGYYPAVPIDADLMVLPVWPGVTKLGYALLGGGTIDVTEVFGTTPTLGSGTLLVSIPVPLVISPISAQSLGAELTLIGAGSPSNQVGSTANRSWLIPFRLSETFTCTSAFVLTGTTIAGHWDVGVYDSAFALLGHTGSQSEANASSINTANLSLTLAAGHYYLAFAIDSATASYQMWGAGNSLRLRGVGFRWADSNFPLATGPTVINTPIISTVPFCGISGFTI